MRPGTILAATFLALVQGAPSKSSSAPQDRAKSDAGPLLYLPFEFGTAADVETGNGERSHSDQYNWYAVDFGVAVGTPVVAMAPGKVVFVKQDTLGETSDWHDNNQIAIKLADGSVTIY